MAAAGFAERLRALREAAGLTQRELAARAGLGLRTVGNLEQGLREPAWATVLALAAALGVDCTAFTTAGPAAPSRARGRPRKERP
jgi:transcriptional regulator with XRE-family HTH domain